MHESRTLMECNKEEAERCKALSENHFKRNDLVGAKKFALKARQLFPALEGLPQLLSILDVHIAALQKLRTGESNCYGILQVDFQADDSTIRKQYRKLALVLHPDKNKAFGAEAAFKHISEAWSVLSDKDKKFGFDRRWRDHMAILAAVKNSDAWHTAHASVSKGNLTKSQNVAHQGQTHVPPTQGAQVHSHQGQFHPRGFQQGHGRAHARQQEWRGRAYARQQQGQRQAHAHSSQQQGQRQAREMASQQQRQHQTHASPLQGQEQQQERYQACVVEQQGQSQGHANQRQGHEKLSVRQEQGQSHGDAQHEQDQQVHVQHQQGQGPMHACQDQGQGTIRAQGQAHQAPIPQKHQVQERQAQGQVHVHQQQGQIPAHTRPQQGAQGEAHQVPVLLVPQKMPSQPAFQHMKSTFWTACPSCRMQIEYEKVHMNKNLCCPMCYKAFMSKEIEPAQGVVIWPPSIPQSKPDSKTDAGIKISFFDSNSDQTLTTDSSVPAMVHSEKTAKIGAEEDLFRQHGHQKPPEVPVQPAQKSVQLQQKGLGRSEKDKLRKKVAPHAKEGLEQLIARSKNIIAQKLSEEAERKAAVDRASAIEKKKKSDNEKSALASGPSTQNTPAAAEEVLYVHGSKEKANDLISRSKRLRTRNSTKPHKKARVSQKGSSFSKSKPPEKGISQVEALQRKRKLASPVDKSIEDENEGVSNFSKEFKSFQEPKNMEVSDECSFYVGDVDGLADKCRMEVPDPDFHNFDGDRTEDHFASGQIWASYDDDDGMPRYYGFVDSILSHRPLKMQMNWLEARSPSAETLAWLNSGFQHSCGYFELGSMYIAEEVSTFSHLVAVDQIPKGGFKIYPRQGNVWAVYKDWEILKVKEDKRGYEMVEIVADFDEEKGFLVSPLFKVAGFKTIFERKRGEDHVKWIPPQELRRLSHQVPAHHIVEGEIPRIQSDCLELDPASTPMNLIYGKL